jgi:hypothetical protein
MIERNEPALKPAIFLKAIICSALIFFSALMPLRSQDSLSLNSPPKINKTRLFTSLGVEAAAYAGLASYLELIWYKDKPSAPFHLDHDFKGYQQVDKFGHVFGSYYEGYIGYNLLRFSGVKKTPSLLLGGTLGLIMQTPIEIFDGIHESWGWSWGDILANTIGTSLFIGQELLFDDQVVKYKVSWHKSPYPFRASGEPVKPELRNLFDYNSQTYWLSVPLKKIMPASKIPPWICVAAGYGATGMYGKYENLTSYNGVPVPPTDRYRKYMLTMDIDWTKIKTDSKFLRAVFDCLIFVKLPFPALEYNSLGQFKGHWLYY